MLPLPRFLCIVLSIYAVKTYWPDEGSKGSVPGVKRQLGFRSNREAPTQASEFCLCWLDRPGNNASLLDIAKGGYGLCWYPFPPICPQAGCRSPISV